MGTRREGIFCQRSFTMQISWKSAGFCRSADTADWPKRKKPHDRPARHPVRRRLGDGSDRKNRLCPTLAKTGV